MAKKDLPSYLLAGILRVSNAESGKTQEFHTGAFVVADTSQ